MKAYVLSKNVKVHRVFLMYITSKWLQINKKQIALTTSDFSFASSLCLWRMWCTTSFFIHDSSSKYFTSSLETKILTSFLNVTSSNSDDRKWVNGISNTLPILAALIPINLSDILILLLTTIKLKRMSINCALFN